MLVFSSLPVALHWLAQELLAGLPQCSPPALVQQAVAGICGLPSVGVAPVRAEILLVILAVDTRPSAGLYGHSAGLSVFRQHGGLWFSH